MTARGGIDGFVRRLSWRYRAWTFLLTLAGHALLAATVLLLVDLLPASMRRPLWVPAWIAAGAWLVAVGLWSVLRLRVPLSRADRELGLQDRLLTWVGLDRQRRGLAAAQWLGEDLERRLAALPPARVQVLVRRPLGALRYLVPVLVLLLLLRVFAPLQPPRLPMPESSPPVATGPDPSRSGDAPAGEDRQHAPPPPPQADPPQSQPQPPRPNEPPRPILQLPPRDEFTIPQFVGDGATRRELARLAELEAGAARAAGRRGAAAGGVPEPPEAPAVGFQRAAEQALRARHVPLHERPFVQRYFEVAARALGAAQGR
jgi:hypothetical protein